MNIQIGFFLFLFWLHAWHKSVHNWSWFRTCRYLIGLHPKFWNTDLDYKWCVFQHSTINLLNTWLHKLNYNHLYTIPVARKKKSTFKSTHTCIWHRFFEYMNRWFCVCIWLSVRIRYTWQNYLIFLITCIYQTVFTNLCCDIHFVVIILMLLMTSLYGNLYLWKCHTFSNFYIQRLMLILFWKLSSSKAQGGEQS